MAKGFTLAEVLVTLGIIGVVAAMTIPTLIQEHQKRALATATKKFYSTMSQAVRTYMAEEGVDDLRNTPLASDNYEDSDSPEAVESIRNFVTKYMKVAKECDHDANDCFAEKYKNFDGSESDFTTNSNWTGRRDYVLSDGSIIRIGYSFGPIELFVDVNGKKGPNRIGYDLWAMDIFYDGSIDESSLQPECRNENHPEYNNVYACYTHTPKEWRDLRFEDCKNGQYGGCFGHFIENNFSFDY